MFITIKDIEPIVDHHQSSLLIFKLRCRSILSPWAIMTNRGK